MQSMLHLIGHKAIHNFFITTTRTLDIVKGTWSVYFVNFIM